MTIKEFYEATAGNYQEALSRLMKDSLVQRFALKFINDKSFEDLAYNLEMENIELAFRAAHTLKGVCMTLAFSKLATSASEITELLRAGKLDEAKLYFPNVKADYELVIAALGEVA